MLQALPSFTWLCFVGSQADMATWCCLEVWGLKQAVLAKDLRLCCLDLSGSLSWRKCGPFLLPKRFVGRSGHSEGEFISLGHFEQFDLQALFLRPGSATEGP